MSNTRLLLCAVCDAEDKPLTRKVMDALDHDNSQVRFLIEKLFAKVKQYNVLKARFELLEVDFNNGTLRLSQDLQRANAQISRLTQEVAKRTNSQLSSELSQMREQYQDLANQYSDLENRYKKLDKEFNTREEQLLGFTAEAEAKAEQIADELQELKDQFDATDQGFTRQLTDAQTEIAALKQHLAARSRGTSQSATDMANERSEQQTVPKRVRKGHRKGAGKRRKMKKLAYTMKKMAGTVNSDDDDDENTNTAAKIQDSELPEADQSVSPSALVDDVLPTSSANPPQPSSAPGRSLIQPKRHPNLLRTSVVAKETPSAVEHRAESTSNRLPRPTNSSTSTPLHREVSTSENFIDLTSPPESPIVKPAMTSAIPKSFVASRESTRPSSQAAVMTSLLAPAPQFEEREAGPVITPYVVAVGSSFADVDTAVSSATGPAASPQSNDTTTILTPYAWSFDSDEDTATMSSAHLTKTSAPQSQMTATTRATPPMYSNDMATTSSPNRSVQHDNKRKREASLGLPKSIFE